MFSFGIVILSIAIGFLSIYAIFFFVLSKYVAVQESILIDLFLGKIGKIPALIEVMRPYIDREESFDHIIRLHTQAMIQEFRTLYDILGLNAKIQNDFLFLMELSMHTKSVQKDEYFVYIRDFIIEYERLMRSHFASVNRAISYWNLFVKIKNMTGIGFFLP